MRYVDSYRFPFQSTNWMTNVLCGSVCFLIPAIGPLIFMGYLLELVEWLHAKKPTSTAAEAGYPDFNVNRFGDYLKRGIWPFLVQIILSLPVSLFLAITWMILMGIAAAIGSSIVTALIFLLMMTLYFATIVAMNVVQVPLFLRAGLSQDFKTGFSMPFVKDFLGRVGRETVKSQAFLIGTGMALMLVGMAAFCVGMYPAMALFLFAMNHQAFQLYELYLERGGEPIPVPPPASV